MTHRYQNKRKEFTEIESLIFDLDGVITQTRKTHQKAWKEMFDRFLVKNKQEGLSQNDYQEYIDGKPRYQGVKSFLDARGIDLPWGSVKDAPGFDTVCALGNMKNKMFHEIIDREGVEVYSDAIQQLKKWREEGYKTAIVSSSKNCRKIIEVAGIADLFDTRVDGTVSEELGLKGKPDPDIFVEAAQRLGVNPENSVVFEDAISGVQAGQEGFFGLVVGVSRLKNQDILRENGADIVIEDFNDLDLTDETILDEYFKRQGEPVFPSNEKLFKLLTQKKPAIFLDYDGTLTPIVSRPEDAIISKEMKQTLETLANTFMVAIVTGRDKEDVENLVGIKHLVYAGSHGYIISGPDGLHMEHPDSERIIPQLDKIEKEVERELQENTQGTQVDRKRYAIGIHYRNARPEDEKTVGDLVENILKKYPGHKKGEGKKIVEIKPDIDWHKGKAVEWIMDALNLSSKENILPVFIGDDLTDEDAFRAIEKEGVGILVGGHGQQTAAKYALKNVFQVKAFFKKLMEIYDEV